MADRPPVSIIILTYNGKDFLKGCLDSVLAQDYPEFEVMVVDNGSSDGVEDYIRDTYPQVTFVRIFPNVGFAGGNNRGVEVAKHDLVILLNNDVVVDPNWLGALVDCVQQPGVGLASSRCWEEAIPPIYFARNGTINFVGRNIMLAFPDPSDIFYSTGCSCIFRKSEFGLPFDEDYFIYSEDTYLGLRCRFAGRKVKHSEASRLLHFGSATNRKEKSSFVIFFQERNRLLNNLLFFSVWTNVRFAPYIAVNFLATVGYGVLKARKGLPGVLKANWWIWTHPLVILRKRREIQKARKVPDKDVIRYMSCKLLGGNSGAARFFNKVSEIYCRIVGLRTIEIVDGDWQTEFVKGVTGEG